MAFRIAAWWVGIGQLLDRWVQTSAYELTWGAGAITEHVESLGGGSLDAGYDRITAHELGCTIHGAEEIAFIFKFLAPGARICLVDQTCGKVCIDRHLLAW